MSKGPKFAVARYKKINKKYKDRKRQFFVASTIRALKRARVYRLRKKVHLYNHRLDWGKK